MAKQPVGVWGIDIGQCAVKALRLEMIDGQPTATAFDYIEHQKILSQPDADPETLIRESLDKFLSRNEIGKDHVAVSIAGQSGALMRFVKLPPVEEKKVPDIVKFEARQQIPFPLDEVVWDYQKIGGGDTVGGFAMETEIGLFAMKRDLIAKNLGYYQGTRTEVHTVQMTPLALVNYATYEVLGKGGPNEPPAEELAEDAPRNKKRCVVVLDVGTDTSNLIITDGAKIIWQRNVNIGGGHFTKALTKELKLTFAKAEHLKRNAAKSPDLAAILKALRPVLTEFVGEVQRSLGFFTNTHRDAHIAYMVGLGSAFKLPGLQKYLSEKLSIEVRKPTSMTRLDGDTVLADPVFAENVLTFPVAYGLAIQGLGLARLQTNLLPAEVRVDRLIRAKKPAVAAAAAALLLGTGMLAVGYGAQLSTVQDARIAKGIEEAQAAKKAADAREAEFNAEKAKIDGGLTAVKAIVVGNDERLNWIRLQEVVAACLPRPPLVDPVTKDWVKPLATNLDEKTPFDQTAYWNTAEAKRAIELYQKRLAQGVPAEEITQDDLAQHLPIVNIEAVYCRYVDSLPAFFEATDAYVQNRFTTAMADQMRDSEREEDADKNNRKKPKVAEGGGWVFELRGYTYHKDAVNFVPRSLLRNLQRADRLAPPAGKRIEAIIPDGIDPVFGTPAASATPAESTDDGAATETAAAPAGEPLLSHPFLLFVQPNVSANPAAFKYIRDSVIDPQVSGGGAGGMGMPGMAGSPSGGSPGGDSDGGVGGVGPGGPGAAGAAASGPPWSPAGTAGTGGGFGGFGPGGSGGSGGYPGGRGGIGGLDDSSGSGPTGDEGLGEGGFGPPGGPPGVPGGGFGPPGGTQLGAVKPKTRYEFVVGFVWREPTPTDPTPERDAVTAAPGGYPGGDGER